MAIKNWKRDMTAYKFPDAIVTTDWLADHLDTPNLRIFDCTTLLEASDDPKRIYNIISGRAGFETGHIPGAGFLDIQRDLSLRNSPFGFTMPPLPVLADAFASAGIDDSHRVILYSRTTPQWATRVWWMLRAIGFDNVAILDGGWDKWQAEGHPVSDTNTDTATPVPAGNITLHARADVFTDKNGVADAIGNPQCCTINALSPDLHAGKDPRYGRAGRIAGSVNVPASDILNADQTLPTAQVAADTFTSVGADPLKRIILYCGGGIAATMDAFLLHQLGYKNITVYDASMSEWANDRSLPMEVD
ncbi:MAG: sulfurtransferase [Rhodobacterales bacterium]|nr:sulfurtransferase [Rhodobacterales bacterium]